MQKVFIAAALLVAGAAGAQQAPGADACVSAVRGMLRDPSSMQLVRVTREATTFKMTLQDGRQALVRGYEVVVNAKNGFGGYTGSQLWGCITDAANERAVLQVMPPM